MDAVAQRLIDALRRGGVDAPMLGNAGFEEPASLAATLCEASADVQLGQCLELWLPVLIASAQPLFGARTLLELVGSRRELGAPIDLPRTPALPQLLGASRFLARRMRNHPEWIDGLSGTPPDAPSSEPIGPDWDAIRLAKYRGLLRIAARDLLGRPFEASLGELSDLADRCLVAALGCAAAETGCEPPALLALGKLGGRELNFSSDVDLLFVYELHEGSDPIERAAEMAQLVRLLKSNLERPTEEGFGYRVDLDLRPEGRVGVLANPVDAALGYYESFGAEWERQMLIRLRPVAGDAEAGSRFQQAITPFVYRGLIGPDVMSGVREMKERIEAERRAADRDAESCLKEGPGGIRDVEFLVQAFQLLHGGRKPDLRGGNVLAALDALGALGLLPEATVHALRAAYLWLRRAEHALQLAEEQQTSRVPRDAPAQLALARRMGYTAASREAARNEFLDDWTAVRTEVRSHFDALVLGGRA